MSYYEDEIYHSGYLDGYYDSMELYHSDDEMTEEERRARRKRRRRNIALGVAGVAGAGAAGYAIGRALRKRGRGIVPTGSSGPSGSRGYAAPTGPRLIGGPSGGSTGPRPTGPSGSRGPRPTGPRLIGGPTLKRVKVDPRDVETPIGWNFKNNRPKYRDDDMKDLRRKAYEASSKQVIWDGDNNKEWNPYEEERKRWRERRRRRH